MEKWTDRFGCIWDHKEKKIPGQPFNPGRVQNLKFTSLSPAADLHNNTPISDIFGSFECGFISKFGYFESNLFGSYSELRQNVYEKGAIFPLSSNTEILFLDQIRISHVEQQRNGI